MIESDAVCVEFASPGGGAVHSVLKDFSLTVGAGEFVSVIGPSGCGKTTFLRCVAGLLGISGGSISVNGSPVSGCGPDRRMVFQDVALLPWRTLQANVELGLEVMDVGKTERKERALAALRSVDLEKFALYHPHQVSGGMKQRAGLARALVTHPTVLLMDEPFGALDAQTRRMLQDDMVRVVEESQVTVLLVTHDMEEAALLSDRVFVMGRPGEGLVDVVDVSGELGRGRAGRLEEIRLLPAYQVITERIWDQLRGIVAEERSA